MTNDAVKQLYDQLSPSNQDVVAMLVRNLAEREGIEAVEFASIASPRAGVELWASDLEMQGLSPLTAHSYKQKILALLDKYERPTEVDIRTFLIDISKKSDKSMGTAANYIKAFRNFFGYLYDNKLWNANPALRLKQPHINYTIRRVPTENDIRRLVSVIDDADDYMLIHFMSNTGLRVSEAVGIELRDIDLEQRRISVIGKGHKQRYIYINSYLYKLFAPFVEALRQADERWLFAARRSDTKQGHLNRSAVGALLERYCVKAGIENISPHQLRHFLATFILSHGGDVKAVSELLGHADVTITLKIYHHIGEASMRKVVELGPASHEKLALTMPTIEGESRVVS